MVSKAHVEAHFEVICGYLSSPHKASAARAVVIEKAVGMLQGQIPTEDMLYGALFVAECPELPDAIWAAHGAEGFEDLDPFSANVRGAWLTTGLGAQDTARIFGNVFKAHEDGFKDHPADSLRYALEIRNALIVEQMRASITMEPRRITEALLYTLPALSRIEAELTEAYCILIVASKCDAAGWEEIMTSALKRHNPQSVLLAAKCGVDMTGYAGSLEGAAIDIYHSLLRLASSNHGRLRPMNELPAPAELTASPCSPCLEILKRL